tara:strand:- start:740 stop:1423 length:684 start_codon:yes stop_codon:yes gene_type:complete
MYANENPLLLPFGPPVYLDKMEEKYITELDNKIEELGGKLEFDASGLLAGRIRKQTNLEGQISPELEESIIQHHMRYYRMTQEVPAMEGMPIFDSLSMKLTAIWSNIQEAREYNPPHSHTGHFSFVIYCRNDLEKYSLEQLQDNEYDKPHRQKGTDGVDTPEAQNMPLAGLIELQYGEPNWMNWTQFRHVPSRGDILIFPNWLRHTVYAHYEENHVRISVAGNVILV